MDKWILEADIHRLNRQLREGPSPEARPKLLDLLQKKESLLGKAR